MMPEMDGFQALVHLKSSEQWKGIPVIAVTARAMPEERRTIIASGFDGYISKPVDADVLVSTMESLLEKKSVERGS